MKLISDAYLYSKADYSKRLFDYLMSAERVDKLAGSFSDVNYAVKRQANTVLLKVLMSNKVVLMVDPIKGGVSRAFKVIYAKDIKDSAKEKKVFIDCTDIITNTNGAYICKKPKTLISYLMTAMAYIIYYNNPKAIISNNILMKNSVSVFVDLSIYVLSYLKIPITYMDNKERMSFVLAEYFLFCVAGIKGNDIVYNLAKNISNIKEPKKCDYLHTLFSFTYKNGEADINDFITKFAEVFLDQKEDDDLSDSRNKLTVESFAHRWMYSFGPGTFLGIECFVPFSAIITDCYCGDFLNQQNTIEKITGGKSINNFSNELLKVGGENA